MSRRATRSPVSFLRRHRVTIAVAAFVAFTSSATTVAVSYVVLGAVNNASATTTIKSGVNGAVLQVTNTNTGTGAPSGVAGSAAANKGFGVLGKGTNGAVGVRGQSDSDRGVSGYSASGSAGVYGQSDAAGGSGVEGYANGSTSAAGVFGHSQLAPAVWGRNDYGGIAFKAQGSAVQEGYYGGWAKALLRFQGDGTFVACYNGMTGSSSGTCGFTITSAGGGYYNLTFPGTSMQYRFVSLSGSSTIILNAYPAIDAIQVLVGNNTYGYAYYVLVF